MPTDVPSTCKSSSVMLRTMCVRPPLAQVMSERCGFTASATLAREMQILRLHKSQTGRRVYAGRTGLEVASAGSGAFEGR